MPGIHQILTATTAAPPISRFVFRYLFTNSPPRTDCYVYSSRSDSQSPSDLSRSRKRGNFWDVGASPMNVVTHLGRTPAVVPSCCSVCTSTPGSPVPLRSPPARQPPAPDAALALGSVAIRAELSPRCLQATLLAGSQDEKPLRKEGLLNASVTCSFSECRTARCARNSP